MLKPFFVWDERVLKRINPELVAYLEAEKNYTNVYLQDENELVKRMLRFTLSSAIKKLPPEIFIRTHRSYAVSIYYIDYIARSYITIGKKAIPIGRQYYKPVMKKLIIIE